MTPPDFQEVYETHFEQVHRWLHRLGIPASELDDALQDVFVVVHRKLPGFRGDAKLATWLFGIATRVAAAYRRRARLRRFFGMTPDDRGDAERPDPGDAPDASLERREDRATLARVLDALPEKQRVVFALVELEGMSVGDVADLVGCPLETARSRLRLARQEFARLARLRHR